jgi:CTP synthase
MPRARSASPSSANTPSLEDAYKSIAEALTHGGMANRTRVRAEWIDAEMFEREDPARLHLKTSTPSLSPAALASAAPKARSRPPVCPRKARVPYLGICLGMQMAVIEAARNLAGVTDAGSEEFDHEAGAKRFTPVVYHLKEWVQGNHTVPARPGDAKGGTMRLGAYTANLTPGSSVAEASMAPP